MFMRVRRKEKEMKHVGVLGMHWGRRKGRSESASEDHRKVANLKKKKLSDMSNEELRAFTTRLQLERQYKDLNQSSFSKGQKILAEVLGNAAKESAKKFTSQYMDQGITKLLKEFGLNPH